MTWYYALGNERQGPIDEATLDGLIAAGTVTPDTLVWRAGMTDWQPLAQARPRVTPVPTPVVPPPPAAIVPAPAAISPTPAAADPSPQPRFGTPAVTPAPAAASGSGAGWSQAGATAGSSPTGTPAEPDVLYDRVVGEGRTFNIGEVIGRAWQLVMDNAGLAIGATAVALVCMVVAGVIPCIGTIIGAVVNPVLLGGIYTLLLKLYRREPAEFGEVFSAFSTSFLPLFLFALVQGLITLVALIPGYALIFAGSAFAERSNGLSLVLSLVGVLLVLPPIVYLAASWMFTPLLIVDKRLDFWMAMETSRKVVAKRFLPALGLVVICGLIMMGGVVALCVGIFVAAPVAFASVAIAYDDLFGRA